MTGSENMKLGSLFGRPKTLASSKKQVPVKESKLAVEMEKEEAGTIRYCLAKSRITTSERLSGYSYSFRFKEIS